MSDNKSIDYLSRLPPELIQNIFHLSHYPNSRSPFIVPPSRYLRPFVERSLYSQTFIPSYRCLELFCSRVQHDRLHQIRRFVIRIQFQELDWPEQEEEDPHSPTSQEFTSLLQRMTTLEELDIEGSSRLALLALSSDVAASSLRNLRSLCLGSTFDPLDDPFNPLHYSLLSHYPSLRKFELSIYRYPESISSFPSKPTPSSFPPLASIKSFALYGLKLLSPHVPALLASLVDVTEVSMLDYDEHSQAFDLANQLPNPGGLLALEVTSFTEPDLTNPVSSPKVSLTRFSNLQSLSISYRVDLRSISFHRDLESLVHLRTLTFGFHTKISVFNLSRSLDNLHLESLVLDGLNTHIRQTNSVTIERPLWTDDVSREGFRKLVKKCREKGIKLSGGSLEAFELEDRFDNGEFETESGGKFEEE